MSAQTKPIFASGESETFEAHDNVPTVSLEEVEALTHELRKLLVRYESTLEAEGIRQQVETLERWMESYRRGLSAAQKLSNKAPEWLEQVRSRLKLAADELMRLEGEGGNPATKEQAAQAEDLMKAAKRVEELAPNLEQMLNCETSSECISESTVTKVSAK